MPAPHDPSSARLAGEVLLRSCTLADLPVLHRIDQQCYEPAIAYSRRILRAFLKQPGVHGWLALLGQQAVGFLLADWQHEQGHLITLDVLPPYRRRKIGTTLLVTAERAMEQAGVRHIELETAVHNAPAIAFWTHHGYRIVGRLPHYYGDGSDAYLMAKLLSPARAGARSR